MLSSPTELGLDPTALAVNSCSGLKSGFHFVHPQNKDNSIHCWIPASPPPHPVLILQAWNKMKVSDGKTLGSLLLTFLAQPSSGEQVPAFQGTSPLGKQCQECPRKVQRGFSNQNPPPGIRPPQGGYRCLGWGGGVGTL